MEALLAQDRLSGLKNAYQSIMRWQIRQHCPTDHGATNGFSANANTISETPTVLVSMSTRVSGILTHPLAPPFL